MQGSINEAKRLAKKYGNAFIPQQFENSANPLVHKVKTAQEIWQDTAGQVDIFITGVGTGGTNTGVGESTKRKNPNVKIIAVEPKGSAVLAGGSPGVHNLQGIGAGFIPAVMNMEIIDEVISVKIIKPISPHVKWLKLKACSWYFLRCSTSCCHGNKCEKRK